MAKKVCVVCGKELGMLSLKATINDGVVCSNCLNSAGITALGNPKAFDTNSIRELIARRQEIISCFKPTKDVGTYIKVDENNRLFKVGGDIFEYANLLSFELLEDGETITKGGLGRAVAGGLLLSVINFGGVGAIVGGVTGGKKSKGICTSMKIRLTLKNAHTDTTYINLITTETKTKGFIYKAAQTSAQQCISALQIIADVNETESVSNVNVVSGTSPADEIMKFKQLLDAGIISQEEFDAKKRQLLGL